MPVICALFAEVSPIPCKAGMEMMGMCGGSFGFRCADQRAEPRETARCVDQRRRGALMKAQPKLNPAHERLLV